MVLCPNLGKRGSGQRDTPVETRLCLETSSLGIRGGKAQKVLGEGVNRGDGDGTFPWELLV